MELPFDPAIPLLGIFLNKPWSTNLKEYKHPYVHCSMIWKQPKCPSVDEWITTMRHLLNGILLEENFTLCNSMDGRGEHYAKQNKPVRERQIPYYLTHIWNLMNELNLKSNTERAG